MTGHRDVVDHVQQRTPLLGDEEVAPAAFDPGRLAVIVLLDFGQSTLTLLQHRIGDVARRGQPEQGSGVGERGQPSRCVLRGHTLGHARGPVARRNPGPAARHRRRHDRTGGHGSRGASVDSVRCQLDVVRTQHKAGAGGGHLAVPRCAEFLGSGCPEVDPGRDRGRRFRYERLTSGKACLAELRHHGSMSGRQSIRGQRLGDVGVLPRAIVQ